MSFKPKTIKIDLSLDMSDYLKEDDEKGDIKPIKSPLASEYVQWAEKTLDVQEDKKAMDNPKFAMEKIVSQIDYWYEKGYDWWVERCSFPVLQEVLKFLTDKVISIQKK